MSKVRKETVVATIVENITRAGVKPTPKIVKSVTSGVLASLNEAAELDPEAVQKALEDAVGQLASLEDFLNPDNMKRFEAAAEFVPMLEEFFGSLNVHFELQKQKEEEAAEEAEQQAADAAAEAEREADASADQAEAEAEEAAAESEEEGESIEAQAEEGAGLPDDAEAEAAAEADVAEEEPEELAEALYCKRWKQLAGIIRG